MNPFLLPSVPHIPEHYVQLSPSSCRRQCLPALICPSSKHNVALALIFQETAPLLSDLSLPSHLSLLCLSLRWPSPSSCRGDSPSLLPSVPLPPGREVALPLQMESVPPLFPLSLLYLSMRYLSPLIWVESVPPISLFQLTLLHSGIFLLQKRRYCSFFTYRMQQLRYHNLFLSKVKDLKCNYSFT